MSRTWKPVGGPSCFCLPAHASCPYPPHTITLPSRTLSNPRVRGAPLRGRARLGRPASAQPTGQVPGTGSPWLRRAPGKEKPAPHPRSRKGTSKPPRFPEAPPKAAKKKKKGGYIYKYICSSSAKDERGPWERGSRRSGRRPLAEASPLPTCMFQPLTQPGAIHSFTHLRLVACLHAALCFHRLRLLSSPKPPAHLPCCLAKKRKALWSLKAEQGG